MEFIIHGLDRSSGQAVTSVITADSFEGAVELAVDMGYAVESLTPCVSSKNSSSHDKSEFVYKMVQVPPNIRISHARGHEAADYMEQVVDKEASQGWDFFRVDTIGVSEPRGCLGTLFGQQEVTVTFYVITFRRRRM